MAGWIKMPIGMEVGLGPGDFVLDGDSAPLPEMGTDPQFWPMYIVAKRLNGSRCHFVRRSTSARRRCVRWGRSPPPLKGAHPTVFDPCLLWPNGWMDEYAIWYESRPRPRPHCVRWEHSSPSPKGHNPSIFGPYLLWPNGWVD